MTEPPNICTTPSPSVSSIEDNSVHRRSILNPEDAGQFNVLAFLLDVTNVIQQHRDEVSDCLSSRPDLTLILTSIIPIFSDNISIPTPPPDENEIAPPAWAAPGFYPTARAGVGEVDYAAEAFALAVNKKRKRAQDNIPVKEEPLPTNSSKTAYKRAVNVTNEAVENMASVGIRQARKEVLFIRSRTFNNAMEAPYIIPQYTEADKREVIKHIRECKAHVQRLRSSSRLSTLVDRAEHALALEHYEECDQANGGHGRHAIIDGPLQVFFAEHWLPDWVEKLPKMKLNLDDTKANKWRDKLRTARFWRKLCNKYGQGIIWILSARLKDTNVVKLTDADIEAMLALIDTKHPHLKGALKFLSEFTSHFIRHGRLPEKRLEMESSSEGEFYELLNLVHDTREEHGYVRKMAPQSTQSSLVYAEAALNQVSSEVGLSPPPSSGCIDWDTEWQTDWGNDFFNELGAVDAVGGEDAIDPRLTG